MASITDREGTARVPLGGFDGTANNPEGTAAEKLALEATLTSGSYIARVTTYTGQTKYGIVRWYINNKPFTTYKSKSFVTAAAQQFLSTMVDISTGVDAPTSVAVAPTTATKAHGATQQLTATVSPGTANQGVNWTTSDATKATVDATGLVTTIVAGSATITATTKSGPSFSGTSVITIT